MLRRRVLIWQLTSRGFCSEITTMLLAYLYCLDKGIDFALCSRYWNAAHLNGWDDYFVPFCDEIATPDLNISYLFSPGSLREPLARLRKKVRLAWLTKRRVLLNYDVWPGVWNGAFAERRFVIPRYAIDGDCFVACQALLERAWNFNDDTVACVADMRRSLDVADGAYCTVHIRRGDKSTEAKPTEVRDYMAKVDAIDRGQIRRCFVMTDDYNVVTELRRQYPNREIVSLCEPSERGHLQAAFNSLPAQARREKTLRLLGELTIATGGAFYVGTFSSSVGRLVAMLRGRDSTFGVDCPFTVMY